MATREQIRDAAKAVSLTGTYPSQDRVLVQLRTRGFGGTQRTIADDLAEWQAENGADPRPEVVELPSALQDEVGRFMRRVWITAMAEAQARLEERREFLQRERDALGRMLEETHVRAEGVDRENGGLRTRLAELTEEAAGMRARLAEVTAEAVGLREEVDHLRATAFWDRVVREVVEILHEREWMTTRQIAQRLPPSLAQEALTRGTPLTPGELNKQLRVRNHHRRFFQRDDETGKYRRRSGWTGITQPRPRVPGDSAE